MKFLCRNCDKECSSDLEVCEECYRDPETNNCIDCGEHSEGIPYPYVCGNCWRKEFAMKRDKAIQTILSTLRNPLALMAIPNREEAYQLAEHFTITAQDLLNFALNKARNT